MTYGDFKQLIESQSKVSKKFYEKLVKEHGKKEIHSLFEQYLNDESVTDEEAKFNRTSVYVEEAGEEMDINTMGIEFDSRDDLVKQYLHEVGQYPLLTADEEIELFTKLGEYKSEVANINIDKMAEKLKSLGYQPHYYLDLNESINHKISFIEKKIKEDIDPALAKELLEIEKQLLIYLEYREIFQNIVNSNLRLVVSIAKRYVGRGLLLLDLIQEGNQGLIKTVERFEVEKGNKFSTYATWWIRQAVSRALADQGRTIRVPVHFYEQIQKVKQAEKVLKAKLGREVVETDIVAYFTDLAIEELEKEGVKNPTDKQIVENMKVTPEKVREVLKNMNDCVSIYTPIGEEEDSLLCDFIPDTKEPVEDIAIATALKANIKEAMDTLTPREKIVLVLRNGMCLPDYVAKEEFINQILTDNTRNEEKKNTVSKYNTRELVEQLYELRAMCEGPITLEDCGDMFGVTRERIRQIEAKAMRKMRQPSRTRIIGSDM